MSKVEILDVTTISHSFPNIQRETLISRDYLLDAIESIFDGETQVVVVEGLEGIGKTTFLVDFVLRHVNRTVSLFIQPTTRWCYDPELIRFDICNQLQWLLRQQEIDPSRSDNSSDAVLGNLLNQFTRRARRQNSYYFFVIDGLDDIPEDEQQIRKLIFDLLPVGLPNLKFIFSGKYQDYQKEFPRVPMKPYPLPAFNQDETKRYLADLKLDNDTLTEIYKTFRGLPVKLAAIKRLMVTKSITNIDELLGIANKTSSLFDFEWNYAKINEISRQALAILAFSRTTQSLESLASYINCEERNLTDTLSGLSFLQMDTNTKEISFVSELFRKYAADKLKQMEAATYKLITNYLLSSKNSKSDKIYLPLYMEKAGRLEELISYLSPDYFESTLADLQSYMPIQTQAKIGFEAAVSLERIPDAVRFALHRAVLSELASVNAYESEVRARMTIGDYNSAIALAQTSILKEDRLHLLALVVKEQHKLKVEPTNEIVFQIEQLVNQLEDVNLGERGIEIASDLLYVDPGLALKLIERVDESSVDHNSLDWAYLRLSLNAIDIDGLDADGFNASENLVSRITNPITRSIAMSAALLVKDYQAAAIIQEASKLTSVGQKMILLRSWLLKNREQPDAIYVVEYSLDTLVRTTEYSPSTRDYREIACPLPYLEESEKALELVRKFDGQKGTLEHLGPTIDYLRLQLILAETEIKFNFNATQNRLTDIYIYICEIKDLSVRHECYARLISTLTRIDPDEKIQIGLRENTENDLTEASTELLLKTAHHDLTLIPSIKALAQCRFQNALQLALSLNIESRREEALEELVDSLANQPVKKINFGQIKVALDHFVSTTARDDALLNILAKLATESRKLSSEQLQTILPLINLCDTVLPADKRCVCSCLAVNILMPHNDVSFSSFITHLLDLIHKSWNTIDSDWDRIDIGFQIATMLAEFNDNIAREYILQSEDLSNETKLNSDVAAKAYIYCVLLTIRAFKGLVASGSEIDTDLNRILDLIEFIPSKIERIRLWSELALQYYVTTNVGKCRQIISEYVKPTLSILNEDNLFDYRTAVVIASPALFCAHQTTSMEMITAFPPDLKDLAYIRIANFILQQCSVNEPYDAPKNKWKDVNYEDLIDICKILLLLEHDQAIVSFTEKIAKVIKNSRRLSRQQQADIVHRLSQLPSKFPINRHIQHNGYKVLIQAYIADAANNRDSDFWNQLISDAYAIPNQSDQSFVLAHLAILLPGRQVALKNNLNAKSQDLIDHIPSLIEQIERRVDLAAAVESTETSLARQYLFSAMKAMVSNVDLDSIPIQRRVIDMAYSIDRDFAASLASLLDDDPARKPFSRNAKKQLEFLDLKDKLVNQSNVQNPNRNDYPRIAWQLLGLLNGGQISHRHISNFSSDLRIAADLPISNSYPIYAYIVENAIQRHSATLQAGSILRQVFNAVLLASEVARRSYKPSSNQLHQFRTFVSSSFDNDQSIIVHPGEREKAIRWLKAWFEENLGDRLIICDQFFGPKELDLLQIIQSIRPTCCIQVLTSWKHQTQEGISEPWDDCYRDYWKNHISSTQNPPDTDIVVVGVDSTKKSPIHDRWWLTSDAGIRVGTSYNSLGFDSNSELSVLYPEEVKEKLEEVNRFLFRSAREINGKKLLYRTITL